MSYTDEQWDALLLTERVASALSLLGCAFVISTFVFSARFRKPVNRLIFYAVFGNILFNMATLISLSGPAAGASSALCQFQGFLIQAFLPADALWNLSMAMNVYLTVFKHYDAQQLRARERWYHLINYGAPFVVAFIYCFISTPDQGKIYGPAMLWCWITTPWDYLRIATCYGVAWYAGGPPFYSNPSTWVFGVQANIVSQAHHARLLHNLYTCRPRNLPQASLATRFPSSLLLHNFRQ